MENQNNGKAIASLIVSCVAILFGCCVWYLAIAGGITATVLGVLALRDENKRQQDLAIAGIVVGGTAIALGVVAAVLYIMILTAAGSGTSAPSGLKDSSDAVLTAVRRVVSLR